MENEYYVYGCYVEGKLRYVGKGKGNRYTHCTSGASTSPALNRDFFSGKDMKVKKLRECLTDEDAKSIEKLLIEVAGDALYNVVGNTSTSVSSNNYACPRDLLRANGFISQTGELVPMTLAEKLVYVYFLDKLVYNKRGESLRETMDAISEDLGVEKKTIGRAVSKMMLHGVIKGVKETSRGFTGWSYDFVDSNVSLWAGQPDNYMILSSKSQY
jgi:hypothetical protein